MILPKTNFQHNIEKLASNIQPQKIAFHCVYAKKKSNSLWSFIIVSAEVSFKKLHCGPSCPPIN